MKEDVCMDATVVSIFKAHRFRWLRRTLEPEIDRAQEHLARARALLAADPEQANRELREAATRLLGKIATG